MERLHVLRRRLIVHGPQRRDDRFHPCEEKGPGDAEDVSRYIGIREPGLTTAEGHEVDVAHIDGCHGLGVPILGFGAGSLSFFRRKINGRFHRVDRVEVAVGPDVEKRRVRLAADDRNELALGTCLSGEGCHALAIEFFQGSPGFLLKRQTRVGNVGIDTRDAVSHRRRLHRADGGGIAERRYSVDGITRTQEAVAIHQGFQRYPGKKTVGAVHEDFHCRRQDADRRLEKALEQPSRRLTVKVVGRVGQRDPQLVDRPTVLRGVHRQGKVLDASLGDEKERHLLLTHEEGKDGDIGG